ncbi:hypothetical protein BV22DRAFT_1009859, partial [Leucogyrophana mollusca]
CAVCLGRHRHRVISCDAPRTWDNKHETHSLRKFKALYTKDGRQLCAKWQRTEGCVDKHDDRHLCSGCGSTSHGAHQCPRAQKA